MDWQQQQAMATAAAAYGHQAAALQQPQLNPYEAVDAAGNPLMVSYPMDGSNYPLPLPQHHQLPHHQQHGALMAHAPIMSTHQMVLPAGPPPTHHPVNHMTSQPPPSHHRGSGSQQYYSNGDHHGGRYNSGGYSNGYQGRDNGYNGGSSYNNGGRRPYRNESYNQRRGSYNDQPVSKIPPRFQKQK